MSTFWSPIPTGVSLGSGRGLFLPFSDFPFKMGIPGFLTRSIDIKLGDFPDEPSDGDIAKSLLEVLCG